MRDEAVAHQSQAGAWILNLVFDRVPRQDMRQRHGYDCASRHSKDMIDSSSGVCCCDELPFRRETDVGNSGVIAKTQSE